MLEQITPLILTYNETPNIDRTLQKLVWANRIVVIDSYSTDETLTILGRYPQVEILQRHFDTHTQQWNYGLNQIQTSWVLSLDADYILTETLIEEIKVINPEPNLNGYFAPFKYCIFGQPLRGSILPARQVLFRTDRAIFQDDGHTQILEVEGQSGQLSGFILHDDRKPLSRWLWAQDRYMVLEVKKLRETPHNELNWSDRLRRQKILAPFVILLYCLILKGGILDGWRGWYYALQRMLAETLLSIRLIEAEYLEKNQ